MNHKLPSLLLTGLLCLSACAGTSVSNDSAAFESEDSMKMEESYSMEEMGVADSESSGAVDGEFGMDMSEFFSDSSAKRIYTGDVLLQATDFSQTVSDLKSLVKEMGGFIENEDVSGYQGTRMYASFTIRIPSDKFDDFFNDVEGTGNLVSRSKSSQNITKNYYDVQARIESLQKERDRLNEMMNQAENVSDLIEIESRLADVERELQSWQQDLSSMDLDLDYSTIYVDVSEVQVYTHESSSPWKRLGSSFVDSWVSFLDGLGELCEYLIYSLPWLLLIALIIWGIYLLVKKLSKNRKGHTSHRFGRKKTRQAGPEPDLPAVPENSSQDLKDKPDSPESEG